MYYGMQYDSPIGKLLLAAEKEHLIGVWMERQKYFAQAIQGQSLTWESVPVLCQATEWLDDYFAGKRPLPEQLPLAPRGTDFQQEVWRSLCRIPYGQTVTYGHIAEQIADRLHRKSMSAQAVGGAVGHNPISIIVPCHRVVGANHSLTGYAGGIQKKMWLLQHEGVDTSLLHTPKKGTAL